MAIRLSYTTNLAVLEMLADKTGSEGFMADAVAVLAFAGKDDVNDDFTTPLAGAVLQNFTTAGVEMHLVGFVRTWARADVIDAFLAYVFDTLDIAMIRAPIPEHRRDVIILAIKSGFRIDGRMREACAQGGDAIMMTMKSQERQRASLSAISPAQDVSNMDPEGSA